jgi:hypothetical protein
MLQSALRATNTQFLALPAILEGANFQNNMPICVDFSVAKKIEVETIHRDGLTANNVPSSDCRFWDFVFIPGMMACIFQRSWENYPEIYQTTF